MRSNCLKRETAHPFSPRGGEGGRRPDEGAFVAGGVELQKMPEPRPLTLALSPSRGEGAIAENESRMHNRQTLNNHV